MSEDTKTEAPKAENKTVKQPKALPAFEIAGDAHITRKDNGLTIVNFAGEG